MSSRIHPISRFLLAVSVLALAAGYFLPLWQIQLWAPQYPEGLNMKIWIDKLSGAFDIINGLNHYIGMALIKEEMFPEFKFMIYLLGALIALGLFAALKGTRRWLWIYAIVLGLGGLVGLGDYYRWGYEYGHNLDPHAAIQVPGMTYQPPLFGYKNLLNFTAFSGPDFGGWVLIAGGSLTGLILFYEQFIRKGTKTAKAPKADAAPVAAAVTLLAALILVACEAVEEPIRYGKDECADCKMTITDQRFGGEIVTKKGKVYKFDDAGCLATFLRDGRVAPADVKLTLLSDFKRPTKFVAADRASYLLHESLKSPMRSDCAAFASDAERDGVKQELGGGKVLKWEDVQKLE